MFSSSVSFSFAAVFELIAVILSAFSAAVYNDATMAILTGVSGVAAVVLFSVYFVFVFSGFRGCIDSDSSMARCANYCNGWCPWVTVVLPCSLVMMASGVATVVVSDGKAMPLTGGILTTFSGFEALFWTMPCCIRCCDHCFMKQFVGPTPVRPTRQKAAVLIEV